MNWAEVGQIVLCAVGSAGGIGAIIVCTVKWSAILELVSHKIISMSELDDFSYSVKEQVQRTLDSYKYF